MEALLFLIGVLGTWGWFVLKTNPEIKLIIKKPRK